jgi:hypothetical protein
MINTIYIISPTGMPIYFKELILSRDSSIERVTLFSGVISAIQSVLLEIDAGQADYFTTKTNEIYMEISESFGVVAIKDFTKDYDREIIRKILTEISTKITFEVQDISSEMILSQEHEQIVDNIIVEVVAKYDKTYAAIKRFSGFLLTNYHKKMTNKMDISLISFLDSIKTGLERVFYALLAYESIIICGDKPSVLEMIEILKIIAPFPFQTIIDYTTTYIDPQNSNVIGIPTELLKEYNNTNIVVINTNKKTADGSKSPIYLKYLLREIRNIKTESKFRSTLAKEMNNILSKCNELAIICSASKFDGKQFQEFRKQMSEDLLNLIVDICSKSKPNLKKYIDKTSFFGFDF